MAHCNTLTKKKLPCPLEADRLRDGFWFCHVHDPAGLFRNQVKAKRDERRSRKPLARKQPRTVDSSA